MKKILIGFLALAIAGGSAFAQAGTFTELPAPSGFITSPNSWTTFGNITYGWTNIMSPAWHTAAQFDNWFGFASFQDTDRYAMAYATRIAGMYFAAYAGGTGFGGFRDRNITRAMIPGDAGGSSWVADDAAEREFGTQAFGWGNNNNRVAILLGVADMGFMLSYATTVSSFNVNSDSQITGFFGQTVFVNEMSAVYGMRQISLGWGMSRNLDPVWAIRPNAEIRLNFARNMAQLREFDEDAPAPTLLDNRIEYSANYVQPELEVSTGWVNFVTTDSGWQIRGDLQYIIGFRVFSNDFSFVNAEGRIQTGNISGTWAGGDFVERSWMNHSIRPRIQLNWAGERINLSTRLVLGNVINTSEANARDLDAYNNITSSDGENVSVFTYQFLPTLELAVRWFAIPDRFTLLAGGAYHVGNITRTVTETTALDANGNNAGTTTLTNTTFATAVAELRVGATFHFNQNFAIDASTGVANAGQDGTVNIFGSGPNNLFTFGRIMGVLSF